jgi:hypothetical protein
MLGTINKKKKTLTRVLVYLAIIEIILLLIIFIIYELHSDTFFKDESNSAINTTTETNMTSGFRTSKIFVRWLPGESKHASLPINVLIDRHDDKLLISCYKDVEDVKLKTWMYNELHYPMAIYTGETTTPVKLLLLDGSEYVVPTSKLHGELNKTSYNNMYDTLGHMSGQVVVAITTSNDDYWFLFPNSTFHCR